MSRPVEIKLLPHPAHKAITFDSFVDSIRKINECADAINRISEMIGLILDRNVKVSQLGQKDSEKIDTLAESVMLLTKATAESMLYIFDRLGPLEKKETDVKPDVPRA